MDERKLRRRERVRAKIRGTSQRPRLSVFRSNRHLFVQIIDDEAGKTLVAVSDVHVSDKEATPVLLAKQVGLLVAKKAKAKRVETAVFDKGAYRYHGIVKAVAEGAREGGLQF